MKSFPGRLAARSASVPAHGPPPLKPRSAITRFLIYGLTGLLDQFQRLRFYLLFLYASPILLLSMIALGSWKVGISVTYFTRDLYQTTGKLPYVGFVSNIGVLMWCAAAAICLFSWALLRQRESQDVFPRFILSGGLLTTILLLDDFFIGHETLRDRGGVPEEVTFGLYAVLLLVWIIRFKDLVLESEYLILGCALGFFASSLLIDTFQESIELYIGHWRSLLEDGTKFMGIFSWFGYFARCCFTEISRVHRNRRPTISSAPF